MKNKILLLEDDESLRRAVGLKLSKENYMVYQAADIKTAAALYHEHLMPLIICDINLPDGSGLDFFARIRAKSNVFFLFLTAFDAETDMIKGYEAGADDYITKPFSLAILVSKVNAMMKRCSPKTQGTVIRSGSIELLPDENLVKKDGQYLTLTANEQKLLSYFMQNPMHILSKNQLLEAIWDINGNFVDENTLAVNIRRLREKIYSLLHRSAGCGRHLFMMFCLIFVKNLSLHEVHTVQNLAGATISAYPETESVFLQALGNPFTSQINTGDKTLSRYG